MKRQVDEIDTSGNVVEVSSFVVPPPPQPPTATPSLTPSAISVPSPPTSASTPTLSKPKETKTRVAAVAGCISDGASVLKGATGQEACGHVVVLPGVMVRGVRV